MKINIKKSLENSTFIESLKKLANTNFVAKSMFSLFIWFIALIPTYIFFLIRWAVGPSGFWEELALIIVLAVVAGWVQVGTIFFAVIITVMLIFDEF